LKSRASLYTAGEGRNCWWSPAYKPQSYNHRESNWYNVHHLVIVSRGVVARVWSSPSSPNDEMKNIWSFASTPLIHLHRMMNKHRHKFNFHSSPLIPFCLQEFEMFRLSAMV
jgi:hypothetical protein